MDFEWWERLRALEGRVERLEAVPAVPGTQSVTVAWFANRREWVHDTRGLSLGPRSARLLLDIAEAAYYARRGSSPEDELVTLDGLLAELDREASGAVEE